MDLRAEPRLPALSRSSLSLPLSLSLSAFRPNLLSIVRTRHDSIDSTLFHALNLSYLDIEGSLMEARRVNGGSLRLGIVGQGQTEKSATLTKYSQFRARISLILGDHYSLRFS